MLVIEEALRQLKEGDDAFQISNVVYNALKDGYADIEINDNDTIEDIAKKYCKKHYRCNLNEFRYKEDILAGVKKYLEESLNEDLNDNEYTELTNLLKQFKELYARIKELVSKLPQEEKKEIGSMLANISLSNITTKEDSLKDIENAINNVESKLKNKPKAKQKWEEMIGNMIEDKVHDIINDASDNATSTSSDMVQSYEDFIRYITDDENGYFRIEHIVDDWDYDLIEEYMKDNNINMDLNDFIETDEYTNIFLPFKKQKWDEEFKKQYEWLNGENYEILKDISSAEEVEIYKEIVLDGWKEEGLPM